MAARVSGENDRPQDVGRRHTRRAIVAPATLEVLDRYRAAMRDELGELLIELRPDRVQTVMLGGDVRLKPPIADRIRLWDLAIKLGRELATGGTDEPDAPLPVAPAVSAKRRQAPRISARERRTLGG